MTPEFLRGFYDGFSPLRRNCAGHNNPIYENGYEKGEKVRGMLNQLPPLIIELSQRQEDIRQLREDVTKLKAAIEAMRTAGGSEEFQIAFDRAKGLATGVNATTTNSIEEENAQLKAEIQLIKRTWLPPVTRGECPRAL